MSKARSLVWVPSQTVLVESSKDLSHLSASGFQKLQEPKVLLVLAELEDGYKILYEGKNWYVSRRDVYQVEKEKEHGN